MTGDDASGRPGRPLACPTCARDGVLTLEAGGELQLGTVGIHLERRPVVTCPEGHREVPEQVIGHAMAATDAAVPRARGRLLRREACSACSTPLTMPARRTTRAVTVEGDGDVPVLTLRFDLPLVRCGACGLEQLPTRSQEDLVVSVPAVFARSAEG